MALLLLLSMLQRYMILSFAPNSIFLVTFNLFDQVSPAFVRGTYGSFTQIATCLGLLGSLLIGIPAKDTAGW